MWTFWIVYSIAGVIAVEVLAGLYLCGSHISWEKTGGAQLFSIPKLAFLPHVQNAGILIRRPIPWNYYQNAVTSSYSFAWWDWKRWRKEIDWMALQGINLPLASTGQEAIWQKVFQKFNISSSDLDDFFGGPAFLAWSRMGNLHGILRSFWLQISDPKPHSVDPLDLMNIPAFEMLLAEVFFSWALFLSHGDENFWL
ncbi:hypothetical protein SLEP1_g3015 [Rubroshorea leprosula]|uniref:Alpha-N-acetylglucosaminidase tim-barrel domain-containing protein n=1 Tax=Rubroshorea leprosula TaxID=152421 RepID=A0AAV5HUF3_9ROSI|nr:hypothetical protein SLEP1_g3015 [Rubroshorea leprosula]